MNSKIIAIALFAITLLSCNHGNNTSEIDPSLTLWYNSPADDWTSALPVGNGRLGAMIYGGVTSETIQFNEETLWTGQPHDYAHKGASDVFEELKDLLADGKQIEAHVLANEKFMSQPLGQFCYQPFGKVILDFPTHKDVSNYSRKLDIQNALSVVNYDVGDVSFTREVFASNPDQAIIINLSSSKKKGLNFSVGLSTQHSNYKVKVVGNEVVISGYANNYSKDKVRAGAPYPKSQLTFEARIKVLQEGGELQQTDNTIKIVNASSAMLQLVAATSFISFNDISGNPTELCQQYLNNIDTKLYSTIKTNHIADFNELFNRVELDLGKSDSSYRPTNERLISFKQDEDPSLVSLFYQYGRYLLISSSRKGTQPANLQGIWNDKLTPPWDSKYTININTEMNYWLAEMTNLSELTDPLINMVTDLSVTGQSIAREHYDLEGWVTHHNTDIWRGAAPINNANHGIWPVGGAWLSQHLWWHYEYSNNKEYLKKIYPVLKEASTFFVGYLSPDPNNPEQLISGPSNSPEQGGLVMGPSMDHQIIRNLFSNTIEAAELLNMDADFVSVIKDKRSKIAKNKIGKHGQLQEWLEDVDKPKNKHRHVSHLWALHPGNEIHPLTTPDLAEACRVTLAHRGDGGTGWSRAWKINFWARLLDGDHSFLLLRNLMTPSLIPGVDMRDKGGLYINLFDAHPPFQIDGNFGATSGITEMLLQSHLRDDSGNYYQDILPALPSKLSSGSISGIKGRDGFEFTIAWESGILTSLKVKSLYGNKLNLRYKGKQVSKTTSKGESLSFSAEDFK